MDDYDDHEAQLKFKQYFAEFVESENKNKKDIELTITMIWTTLLMILLILVSLCTGGCGILTTCEDNNEERRVGMVCIAKVIYLANIITLLIQIGSTQR